MRGGFGGMMSLLIDGDAAAAKRVATATKLFIPATSLGGVESLIEHRKSVEGPHSIVPANLLRLSVGIEDVRDLIVDLEQALEVI
jgi:cystathionine gamma-synthase